MCAIRMSVHRLVEHATAHFPGDKRLPSLLLLLLLLSWMMSCSVTLPRHDTGDVSDGLQPRQVINGEKRKKNRERDVALLFFQVLTGERPGKCIIHVYTTT